MILKKAKIQQYKDDMSKFKVSNEDTALHFYVENDQEREKWICALEKAIKKATSANDGGDDLSSRGLLSDEKNELNEACKMFGNDFDILNDDHDDEDNDEDIKNSETRYEMSSCYNRERETLKTDVESKPLRDRNVKLL